MVELSREQFLCEFLVQLVKGGLDVKNMLRGSLLRIRKV